MSYRSYKMKYGLSDISFTLKQDSVLWEVHPTTVKPVENLESAISQSIRNPIGSKSIKEIIRAHGKKTLIIVDDNTRQTPQKIILPILIKELNKYGVSDEDITILIALGTHRRMSEAECIERFGNEVMSRIKVVNLSQNEDDFLLVEKTQTGIPVSVAKIYLESEVSIAVGNIIPHMYAGWAGGAKMIQPGITNKITTGYTHLMAGENVYDILGNAENPVRKEMEEIAIKTGLKFIVNVVLNGNNEVVEVVSGDVVKAHRKGVDVAKEIYQCRVPDKAEIVIASSHPADRDLWQGFKPLNNCGMMVKDGGTLILVIPAPEGIAPDHHELIDLGTRTSSQVREMLSSKKIKDIVAAATFMAFDQTRKRINIILVSHGILSEEAQKIGCKATVDIDAAIEMARMNSGGEPVYGIVYHGADVLPKFGM
jgi:lactate racemase